MKVLNLLLRCTFISCLVTFATKVYHPNIDTAGRICLDLLKVPPKGSWKPNLNLALVLKSIRLLLSEPNPGRCPFIFILRLASEA